MFMPSNRFLNVQRLSENLAKTDLKKWDVRHVSTIESTNSALLLEGKTISKWEAPVVLIADYQSSGRGRLGRKWFSLPGCSLICSVGMTFRLPVVNLMGSSLAVSLAISMALEQFYLNKFASGEDKHKRNLISDGKNISLKWPNDILFDKRKLAGILVEVARSDQTLSGFPMTNLVIGFGLNLVPPSPSKFEYLELAGSSMYDADNLRPSLADYESLNAAYLNQMMSFQEGADFQADLLLGILQSLNNILGQFAKDGFAGLRHAWWERHAYCDQEILVSDGGKILRGRAVDIDDHGRLLVQVGDVIKAISSGELDPVGAASHTDN